MKNAIKEYLELSKTEKAELWKNAVFIFDTNIFLNLYRYTEITRESLLKAMQQLSDRIWMPHQVAQELMKDRAKVIFDTLKIFDELNEEKEKFIANCREKLRRESKDTKIDNMSKEIDRHIKILKSESNYIKKVDDDEILNKLLKLFEDKVGAGFSESELDSIKREGVERYSRQTPPGYKDYKKGEENNAFGDLIIWKEILQYAGANKKDIIYVTGDQKEDWWNRTNGRTLGPRVELRKEFAEKTNQKFHMYNMNGFLTYYKELQGTSIQQSAIDEVKSYEKFLEERHRVLRRQELVRRNCDDIDIQTQRLEMILHDLDEKQKFAKKRLNLLRHEVPEDPSKLSLAEIEETRRTVSELQQLQAYLYELSHQKADVSKRLEQLVNNKRQIISSDIVDKEKELALI